MTTDLFNNLESRYLAFKWRDIEKYLSDAEQRTLTTIAGKVLAARVSAGRGELLCLCIEHDWPEFPPALNALTTRIGKEAGNQPDVRNRLAFSHAADGSIEIYACQTGTQLVLPAADVPLLIHGLQSHLETKQSLVEPEIVPLELPDQPAKKEMTMNNKKHLSERAAMREQALCNLLMAVIAKAKAMDDATSLATDATSAFRAGLAVWDADESVSSQQDGDMRHEALLSAMQKEVQITLPS